MMADISANHKMRLGGLSSGQGLTPNLTPTFLKYLWQTLRITSEQTAFQPVCLSTPS